MNNMDFRKELVDRFLKYVVVDTQSSEEAAGTPSTQGQMQFARLLEAEMVEMGLSEISLDENGYLFATLPANTPLELPTIGFIAHLDTSPDMSGKNVKPRIVKDYDGSDIILNEKDERYLSPADFPEMLAHKGQDLIVTDGTTLLGADDKAGVAEIMTAISYLQKNPDIKHGKIRVGFNPDEEIGLGAHKFDVARFGCTWAYTMDGGEVGELEYENFNAAAATVKVTGRNVHPGYAKGKMVNAVRVAAEFIELLPAWEAPETTEGYEGFYHPTSIKGGVEEATVSLIIRDHVRERFEWRKATVERAVEQLNIKYGEGTVSVEMSDTYYNMRDKIEPVKYIVEIARQAMEEAGVSPVIVPIRGGTDGAQLSFKGLPCPNIFAGGVNMHSRFEFVPVQSMEKAVMTIVKIAQITATR